MGSQHTLNWIIYMAGDYSHYSSKTAVLDVTINRFNMDDESKYIVIIKCTIDWKINKLHG
jgi:hypothetical protein